MLGEKKLVGSTIEKFEAEGPQTTTKSEKYKTIFAQQYQWLDPQNGYQNKLIDDPMYEYK